MGSINPIFLMPDKLKQNAAEIAGQFINSVTLGVGQFCTNPGVIIGVAGSELDTFQATLKQAAANTPAAPMLHPGIAQNFEKTKTKALEQNGVEVLAKTEAEQAENHGALVLATVSAAEFISNPALHEEVFGPYSLLVVCRDAEEMLQVAQSLKGQLTSTLFATGKDLEESEKLSAVVQERCGRIIFNQFPTGVEVCLAMHHGGPFPATTNSAYTSVGADGIKRFTRPLSFQNWPDEFLPDELKNDNPLEIWRTVNNELTMESVNPVVAN
jgi:NADP-dependent aldehyde dehydrogenase